MAEREQRTIEDLYAFGNAKGPRLPRPDIDVQVGIDGTVGPTDPQTGASTYTDPSRTELTGHYHRLRMGTILPEELGVYADGEDVGGSAPWGHRTIYPVRRISIERFIELWRELPWEYAGKRKP